MQHFFNKYVLQYYVIAVVESMDVEPWTWSAYY